MSAVKKCSEMCDTFELLNTCAGTGSSEPCDLFSQNMTSPPKHVRRYANEREKNQRPGQWMMSMEDFNAAISNMFTKVRRKLNKGYA